jgi:flagellin-specific chaperone FliS
MMDSQENVLNNEAQLEETNQQPVAEEVVKQEENVVTPEPAAEEQSATEEPAAEEPVVEEPAAVVEEPAAEEPQEEEPAAEEEATEETASKKVYATKKEVIERIKELAHGDESPTKEEVDLLKTTFYKLHFAEREAAQKAYLEAGGDPEKYTILPDEDEEVFKAEMGVVKEKRAKMFLEQEAEKQENLKKKLDIIEKIKGMVTSPEEANKNYQEFKKLQQEWKEIRLVPAEKANELWRNYQLYVEQFYDLLKLNSEAREYDFKKNLEIKNRLCEAAEKLADEPDVISAFHQLQKLHQEYRETGPVAKDLREEIWTRFKAASTVINKKHQQHFDNLRSKEEENLARKTELCEKVEAIAKEENKGAGDWERHTKQIIDLQAEWKTIGFAPQKMNVKIFERFRAACDDFFGRKAEFFKDMKAKFAENADKKRALIEQAKALQDSTEWKSTSDKLIALQKEWKTIGMVPKRLGDQLWNEFLGACNKFFEARNAANQGTRTAERDNLQKKRDIIAQLKALAEEAGENLQENVQQLVDEYQGIGHVPFKEKDKIFKEYHEVLDKLYKDLNISTARRRLDNFKSNIKNMAERGGDVLDNERARLMRRYEGLKQEIQTYENNLGFLNASSKKGNSLIDEMNRKVQKLKDDCELVRQKIKAIDAENTEES